MSNGRAVDDLEVENSSDEESEFSSSGEDTNSNTEEESDVENEDSSDWESEEENEENDVDKSQEDEIFSSESDGESEKCPICLARFNEQDIGTPESCDHNFCLECISEWSKNVNTCPVDRQVFNLILARRGLEGVVFKKFPVKNNTLQLEEVAEEDLTFCEVCGESNREDRLLLCDGCDLGYHCECLDPPLDAIPEGMWMCPDCGVHTSGTIQESSDEEGIHHRPRRLIARTIISERVRNVIATSREQLANRRHRNLIISSDEEENGITDTVIDGIAPSTSRRSHASKSPRRKRRKSRKRKTTKSKRKIKSSAKSKTTTKSSPAKKKKGRKRRRKRRVKKGKARTKSTTPKTIKKRLAEKLGMKAPPRGRSIPIIQEPNHRDLDYMRSDIGVNALSILGNRDDLDPFVHSDDEEMIGHSGGTAVVRAPVLNNSRPRLTKAALLSRRPIRPPVRATPNVPKIESMPSCTGTFDLLGDILAGQSMLSLKTENITIKRDGSLTAKPSHNKTPQNGVSSKCSNIAKEPKDGGEDSNDKNQHRSPPQQSKQEPNQSGSAAESRDIWGGSLGQSSENTRNRDYDDNEDSSGDLTIDMDAVNQPDLDKNKKKESEDKDGELYDPEEALHDDISDCGELYDPEQAIKGSISPESPDEKSYLYDPEEATQDSQSAEERKISESEKTSDLYDPAEATKDSDSSDEIEQDIDTTRQDDKWTENSGKSNDSMSPFRQLHNDHSEHKNTRTTLPGNESGPESPDPEPLDEDSNLPDKYPIIGQSGDLEEQSEDQTPADSPYTQNDITPALSPVEETEIPIAKQDEEISSNALDKNSQTKNDFESGDKGDSDDDKDSDQDEDEDEESEDEYDKHFVPISELPRIPKKKSQDVIVIEDEDSPQSPSHPSVLERANMSSSHDSYRWDKERSKRDKGKRRKDSEGSDGYHKRRYRDDESDDDYHKEKKKKYKHKSRSRSRSKGRSRDRERYRRSCSKSRERKRSSRRRSRSKSRDREHRRHSRSRERRHRSRSRTPKKKDKYREKTRDKDKEKTKDRDRDRDREREREREKDRKKRNRDRSRSRSRDRFGRSDPSEFKASIRTFTQTLKEATAPDQGSRKFKLKRNFYNEILENSNSSDVEEESAKWEKTVKPSERVSEKQKENQGGWKRVPTPPPQPIPEQKIETVVSSVREKFARNAPAFKPPPPPFEEDDDEDSLEFSNTNSPNFESEIKALPRNNIAINVEEPPPPLPPPSSYDPSNPTDDQGTPPIPPENTQRPPLPNSDLIKRPPPQQRINIDLGQPRLPQEGITLHSQIPLEQQRVLVRTPMSMDQPALIVNPRQPPPPRSPVELIREPIPGILSQEAASRQGLILQPGLQLNMLQQGLPPGMLVNPLLGPPPPFQRFPTQIGTRLRLATQPPTFIQLPSGQRIPASQNGLPLQAGRPPPEGVILDGMIPGMRLPDMRLPPPPAGLNLPENLNTPPPPLPAKALEEMQQISNLLNAQAKLAELAQPPKIGQKEQSQQSILGPPPGMPLTSMPPPNGGPPVAPTLPRRPGSMIPQSVLDGAREAGVVFKVPLPPKPIVQPQVQQPQIPGLNLLNAPSNDVEEQTKKKDDGADTSETTEVVDMDVSSPLSDDEYGINVSFNPPLKKRSKSRSERDKEEKKARRDKKVSDDIEAKINEVFGKKVDSPHKEKDTTTTAPTKKKKEKSTTVKFNLAKSPTKPKMRVQTQPLAPQEEKHTEDMPTSAVELDKQQKVSNQFMKKLNRQERVVEEVKLAIKPHYAEGKIDKEDYKEIMRKAVPKICHSKSGGIDPEKIRNYVEAYVMKVRQLKKYNQKKQDDVSLSKTNGSHKKRK